MNEFLESLRILRESEDHIEFKEAKHDFNYNGGEHKDPKKRRHCVLGYVAALANEGGGRLVFGMADHRPHDIVGTTYEMNGLGALEDAIYEAHGIRVRIDEHFDGGKRVVIFNVPSRPIGKMLRFEGVPLMRVGESLRPMSDDEMRKILNEQEPDFSAKICDGLTMADLDEEAIRVLKEKYSEKQKNPAFKTMPTQQVLKDFELSVDGKLNYAALMLLGKAEVIHRRLPQYEIIVEYRKNKASIQYNARKEFVLPLFLGVYKVWNYLNQPLSNPENHLRIGPDMRDIQAFNEDSIREGILNALAHRSLQMVSSVVIKQSPDELSIVNPGGFPLGVNLDNILTVCSNPRQKRVAEVLEKTGLVERSGQGVDKMFANCIMDGKLLPSFEGTDDYQVCLTFFSKMQYPKLAQLVRTEQLKRGEDNALNIFQLMCLYRVERGEVDEVQEDALNSLIAQGLVKKWRKKWIVNYDSVANVANELTERQEFILDKMLPDVQYATQSLSRMTDIGVRTLQRELLALEQMGRVKRFDKGKNVRWMKI